MLHKPTITGFFLAVAFFCAACDSTSSLSSAAHGDSSGTSVSNDSERALYARCIAQCASERGLAVFWWDCGTMRLFDRSIAEQTHPLVIQAITTTAKRSLLPKNDAAFKEESAQLAVKNIGCGWNLGNTLDSTSYNDASTDAGWIVLYGNGTPLAWETAWGEKPASKALIESVREAGFGAVRVPVTWAEHILADGTIDGAWLSRVQEVVGWVLESGMYCVLNVHHDGGADGWIKASVASRSKNAEKFTNLWKQIAEAFKDCSERLLFESMNEVLDERSAWGGTNEEGYNAINAWNQDFVTAVRATGGNNAVRNLIIMDYAGSCDTQNLTPLTKPQDSAQDHLILEVHNYNPPAFTTKQGDATWFTSTELWNEADFSQVIQRDLDAVKEAAARLGMPAIIGECGAEEKSADDK